MTRCPALTGLGWPVGKVADFAGAPGRLGDRVVVEDPHGDAVRGVAHRISGSSPRLAQTYDRVVLAAAELVMPDPERGRDPGFRREELDCAILTRCAINRT